jgi:hypothetical protein
MPWRTRKKGSNKQRGSHFFIDDKSQQQRKLNLQSITPEAEQERKRRIAQDAISRTEQIEYGEKIGIMPVLDNIERDDEIEEAPPETYRIEDGIAVPLNQELKPSLFNRIKERIMTKSPKKEDDKHATQDT